MKILRIAKSDGYIYLDDLSISYDGNMISSVHSAGTKAATFAGRAGAALREGDYDLRWDEAARLKYDETRRIVDIRYNSLGQPASMRHSWGDLQTYTYDGLGRRTEANYHTVRNATDHRRRYHASGLVTCNDTIETLRFPGGYFDRALQAHYYVTDYQGNNIAVLPHQIEARPEQRMSYYPYGEPHRRPTASGSPSASTQNRYLFADKEYTDFGGESQSDFGPRTLNLPIPFFATQDRHADDYHGTSPYAYCAGNPIMNIDPTGNDTYALDSIGYIILLDKTKERDEILFKSGDKTESIWKGNYATITKVYNIKTSKGTYDAVALKVNNDSDGLEIFEAISKQFTNLKGRPMEWCIIRSGEKTDDANYISTSHQESTENSGKLVISNILKGGPYRSIYHSHPCNIPYPSDGDIESAGLFVKDSTDKGFNTDISFKIYLPSINKYIPYENNPIKIVEK